jgi:cytochrome c-type biogenesis protein CcmF
MEGIQYVGEHLLPGQIGQAAIVLGFVASLLASVAYFFATQRRDTPEAVGWLDIGRWSFVVHGAATFLVIGIIFFIMSQQYYEYQYVQAHVSDELPMKYIFSAFWEGQEGSFLLWMFWHIVLGMILLLKAGRWEAPTLAVIALIQAFISSMILGVYLGFGEEAWRLGSNPLLLLRDVMDAPIFASADYVTQIQGSGLNPLLQNYWMTIHPPTLFLGFASTAIPFAYAIAGLWTKEHQAWLKPALPWALFSGAILGTGILMGGAWAYEALSFGGYWAWDPVENMSLVPWLILIAGIHTNLIARNTGHSIRSTYVYYLLTFVFIVYSTFLTRSGVLGETSVHAFTEMGLEAQLVAFILFFLALSAVLFGVRFRGVTSPPKEEATPSKEFWMFIGSLVLLFSGLIITASTSLPVYNKIREFFDPLFQGRVITDPIPHYNKYQIWIAVFIGLLSGGAQYLRYREFNFSKYAPKFLSHTGIALALSGLLSYLTTLWIDVVAWQYLVLLFFGWFTIVANADYLITFAKGNLKTAGSSMAHIGFGLMIVGILASGLNQEVISRNSFVMEGLIEGASNEQLRRNVLLFQGNPMIIGEYEATYVKDTIDVLTRTYTVNYKRRNQAGEVVEEFDLHPNVLYDKSFTKIAASNPSTKRYWDRDIFTHIASLPQVEIDLDFRRQREDSLNYRLLRLPIGQAATLRDTVDLSSVDTSVIKTYRVALRELDRAPNHPEYHPDPEDITLGATVEIRREGDDSTYVVHPMLALRGQLVYSYPAQINDLGVKVRLEDSVFETVFGAEESLDYQTFSFKRGEEATLNGYRIQFVGFNREPEHPNYRPVEGDIAVSAMIAVQAPDGQVYGAQPVYLIRDSRPLNLKDEVPAAGLHFRFVGIDPQTETIELLAAQSPPEARLIPVEVATNSLRSDYIVLEAIVFPGINLFWLGSTMMMIGLFMGMFYRLRGK